jgi:hypothetical protein
LLSMNLGARTTVIIPSSSNWIMADYWRPSFAVINRSDVRFWPIADICQCAAHVRFQG